MTYPTEQEGQVLDVEQLELNLGLFYIYLEHKLKHLEYCFKDPSFEIDLTKLYYDHVGGMQKDYKEHMVDLQQFLITDYQASTPNLRSTFFRILENPLFNLFKTSKFELFDLCLNGFDIEIEPLEAIKEVQSRLATKIDAYKKILSSGKDLDMDKIDKKIFKNRYSLLLFSILNDIEFKIFNLYSYLRKGAQLLRKTFESRLAVTETFNIIEKYLVPLFVQQKFIKGLKEISTLNFEIYNIEPTYDYFFFYFSIPLTDEFIPIFDDINIISERCHKSNNYNPFIIFFLKHNRGILKKVYGVRLSEAWLPHFKNLLAGALRFLRSDVLYFEEFIKLVEWLLTQSYQHFALLEGFLKFVPDKDMQSLREIHKHYEELAKSQPELVATLRRLTFEQVRYRLEVAQKMSLYSLDFTKVAPQQLKELIEIIGPMPKTYFDYIYYRLKVLNSTISLTNKHKYIASQFKLENYQNNREVIKDINNFMSLWPLYTKEYDVLFATKMNPRYFLDLLPLIKDKTLLEQYSTNCLNIFKKVKSSQDGLQPEEIVKYYYILSQFRTEDTKYCQDLLESLNQDKKFLTISQYIKIVSNLKNYKVSIEEILVSDLFSYLSSYNTEVRKRMFHEMPISLASQQNLTEEYAAFLTSNYDIINDELIAKNNIFSISKQDQSTNPLNLDSRIDYVYLSLNVNAKRAIQVIILELLGECKNKSNKGYFLINLLMRACREYPIIIPYLVSLRINIKEIKAVLKPEEQNILPDSLTFGYFLVFCYLFKLDASQFTYFILSARTSKYINGNDFTRQEIASSTIKSCIKIINTMKGKINLVKTLKILVLSLEIQKKYTKYHIDLVKKLVDLLVYLIGSTKKPDEIFELSAIYQRIIALFFRGKEQELRGGIYKQYQSNKFDAVRSLDVKEAPKNKSDTTLPTESTLTFGVNFDFEVQESLFDLSKGKVARKVSKNIPFQDVKKTLSAIEKNSPVKKVTIDTPLKYIDLSSCKHNILFQLGRRYIKRLSEKTGCIFRFDDKNVYPDPEECQNKADELRNIAIFYMKDVSYPTLSDGVLYSVVVYLLKHPQYMEFMRNPINYWKVMDLLSIVLLTEQWTFNTQSPLSEYLKSYKQYNVVNRILDIFSHLGYSNAWVNNYDDLAKYRVKTADVILKQSKINTKYAILSLLLKSMLNSYVDKKTSDFSHFSQFLKAYFESRPVENTALTYRIPVDKVLLNLMLKCIDFENLHYASILFYANFENLRLYTEDIQYGFKALNLASKTRSHNEFLKLSKEYNDPYYLTPLKIFKENLKFFLKVEKYGYYFKKAEEASIAVEKLANIVRSGAKEDIHQNIDEVTQKFQEYVERLNINTVNRVKTMYLAAKLRDLAIQNGQTISLLYDILSSGGMTNDLIVSYINKIELLSTFSSLHYYLLLFYHSFLNEDKYSLYHLVDLKYLTDSLSYPTCRRFGFNMGKILNKCDFEFDEVLQQALTASKGFLLTEVGRQWVTQLKIYPAFLAENRIKADNVRTILRDRIQCSLQKGYTISTKSDSLIVDLRNKLQFSRSSNIILDGKPATLQQVTQQVANLLQSKQILIKAGKFYIFNRYKFSYDSLDMIEVLGGLLAACLVNNVRLDLPLHNSIISLMRGSMVELDDLVDVDFKTWEYLKQVLAEADCKNLNLTFSYYFEREPGKKYRLELTDKGTSKKVNNLNREEFCDFVCCKILYGFSQLQLDRFQIGLTRVLPREIFANAPYEKICQMLFQKDDSEMIRQYHLRNIRKFGLLQPELFIGKDRSFQNLKDFVNTNWLLSTIQYMDSRSLDLFASKLSSSLDTLNLKVYTKSGNVESIELLPDERIVITHFNSKEKLSSDLLKLIK